MLSLKSEISCHPHPLWNSAGNELRRSYLGTISAQCRHLALRMVRFGWNWYDLTAKGYICSHKVTFMIVWINVISFWVETRYSFSICSRQFTLKRVNILLQNSQGKFNCTSCDNNKRLVFHHFKWLPGWI